MYRSDVNWDVIDRFIQNNLVELKNSNMKKIYDKYKFDHPDGVGYSTFTQRINKKFGISYHKNETTCRFTEDEEIFLENLIKDRKNSTNYIVSEYRVKFGQEKTESQLRCKIYKIRRKFGYNKKKTINSERVLEPYWIKNKYTYNIFSTNEKISYIKEVMKKHINIDKLCASLEINKNQFLDFLFKWNISFKDDEPNEKEKEFWDKSLSSSKFKYLDEAYYNPPSEEEKKERKSVPKKEKKSLAVSPKFENAEGVEGLEKFIHNFDYVMDNFNINDLYPLICFLEKYEGKKINIKISVD